MGRPLDEAHKRGRHSTRNVFVFSNALFTPSGYNFGYPHPQLESFYLHAARYFTPPNSNCHQVGARKYRLHFAFLFKNKELEAETKVRPSSSFWNAACFVAKRNEF